MSRADATTACGRNGLRFRLRALTQPFPPNCKRLAEHEKCNGAPFALIIQPRQLATLRACYAFRRNQIT